MRNLVKGGGGGVCVRIKCLCNDLREVHDQ